LLRETEKLSVLVAVAAVAEQKQTDRDNQSGPE
jgi:hypothetical protein